MPRIIEKTVFKFSELSDSAKERAREWYRSCDYGDYLDYVTEDFCRIADIIGLDLNTRAVKLMNGKSRNDPNIFYSVAHCQGDYAAFAGTWTYKAGCKKAIREYAPNDNALHAIVDDWASLQKRYFYNLAAACSEYRGSQRLNEVIRKGCSRYDEQAVDRETEKEAENIVDRLADWIYSALRAEVEYQSSDEQVDEGITANEYEFYENGGIV